MELTCEQIDGVVVADLKKVILDILKNPYELYHDNQKAYDLIYKMLSTLEYYMRPSEFKTYSETALFVLNQTKELPSEGIINTTENSDGSLTIDVECTKEQKDAFAELGIKYAIIRACIDPEASDSDMIHWAKYGRSVYKGM